MKNLPMLLLLLITMLTQACIGDDFVDDQIDPELRISSKIDSITLNTEYQFEASYFNNIGAQETVEKTWSSLDPDILFIDEDSGLASAVALGTTMITVQYDDGLEILKDSTEVTVSMESTTSFQTITGAIQTTSSYKLLGDFSLTETDSGLTLSFESNYEASTALPGLYLYLSNNKNSIANAQEVARVTVFNGAHSYEINDTGINDFSYLVYFCKPFNVKVGDGEL